MYTGQSITPYESRRFVTGNGHFVGDFDLPNMLHVVMLRSPYAHAALKSVDTTAASRQPGVAAVLHGRDLAGVLGSIPPPVMGPGRPVDALQIPTHPLLATHRVCYTGQPLAIVAAASLALAQDAAEHIEVAFEEIPPVVNPLHAEDATAIHPELGTNVALRTRQQGGDLEAAFARADHVVRQCYDVPRLAPAPLETRGVVADYQPQTDQLTVWNSTQAPHRIRTHLSELLKRPEETIRVIVPDVGGSFGIKDCMFPEDVLIPYLALQLGRPVKWIESRREHLLAYHGRGQWFDIEAAVKRDGTLLGIRAKIVADLGAYMLRTTPFPAFNACRRLTGPYHIPAVQVDLLGVITNKPPTGAYRGTGGPESAFCMERTLDLIALDLGLDAAAVRQRNFIPQDAFPYRTVTGVAYDPGQYDQTLKRALECLDDAYWRAEAKRRQPHEPRIGVGLATCLKSSGASGDHRHEQARVQIEPSGEVLIDTGISPHGQGSETAFAQLAADALGIGLAHVRVRHSDTSLVPFGEGTSASRGLIVGGSAVYIALQAARQHLAHIAAHELRCPVDDIDFQNSCIYNRHQPGTTIPYVQLTGMASQQGPCVFEGSYTLPDNPFTFGAHGVVVEIDPETAAISILRYVGVHDCGHIINPKLVEGQIHGGLVQGIGQALTEDAVYSPAGQLLNGSLLDYAMPRAATMPAFTLETVNTASPTNPLGAKGIGSVATVPAPAAVANAVLDALSGLGIRHLDMPLTPAKIWRALRDAPGETV